MTHGAWKLLEGILKPILSDLWTQAWQAGLDAAETLSGPQPAIPASPSGEHFSDSEGRAWLNQIVRHRLEAIAAVLASTAASALKAALKALLSDEAWAELVALTETVRAMQAAVMYAYRRTGVHLVRWVIADANACPACKENAHAGPHPLGTPFPTGAIAPPEHPRCRCALIPA